jgi:hypothetical protein
MVGGCTPLDVEEQPLPPEVRLVAEVDARLGAPPAVAGLRAPQRPLTFAIPRGQPWLAVGYAPEDLSDQALPDATALALAPLSAVPDDACWRLPPPRWTASLDPTADGLPTPALTAAWRRTCPRDGPVRTLDIRCAPRLLPCGLRLVRRPDCEVVLDAVDCPGMSVSAALEHDGTACVVPGDSTACERVAGPAGSTRWRCGECTLDAYHPTSPRAFTVRTATLGRAQAVTPPNFEFENGRPQELHVGVPRGVAVSGDTVLVGVAEQRMSESARCRLRVPARTALWTLDAETMAVRTRTSTDVCVSAMVADPTRPGFIVSFTRGSTLGVARVDVGGRWSSVHLAPRDYPQSRERPIDASRAMMAVGRAVVVAEETEAGDPEGDLSWIYRFDLETLAPLGPSLRVEEEVAGVAAMRPDRVALLLLRSTVVEVRPIDDLAPRGGQPPYLEGAHAGALRVDAEGRLYVLDFGLPRAMLLVRAALDELSRVVGVAHAFEQAAVMVDVAPRVSGPMLATGLTPDPSVDPSLRRFQAVLMLAERVDDDVRVLPGSMVPTHAGRPIEGPILELTEDGRGRVWGIAPWAGLLVRVELPR